MLRHVDFDVLAIYVHSYGWEGARGRYSPYLPPLGHINVTQIGNCSLTAATPCASSHRLQSGNSAAILFGFNAPQLAHNLKVAKPRLSSEPIKAIFFYHYIPKQFALRSL